MKMSEPELAEWIECARAQGESNGKLKTSFNRADVTYQIIARRYSYQGPDSVPRVELVFFNKNSSHRDRQAILDAYYVAYREARP